jgi:hypothetical protein
LLPFGIPIPACYRSVSGNKAVSPATAVGGICGHLNSNVYSGAQTGESERLLFAQSYYRMLVGFECPAGGALGNRPSVS